MDLSIVLRLLLGRGGVLNFGSTAPSRRYFLIVFRDKPVRRAISRIGVLPQFVWRNYPELGTFSRDSRDFKKALVARERCLRSKR